MQVPRRSLAGRSRVLTRAAPLYSLSVSLSSDLYRFSHLHVSSSSQFYKYLSLFSRCRSLAGRSRVARGCSPGRLPFFVRNNAHSEKVFSSPREKGSRPNSPRNKQWTFWKGTLFSFIFFHFLSFSLSFSHFSFFPCIFFHFLSVSLIFYQCFLFFFSRVLKIFFLCLDCLTISKKSSRKHHFLGHLGRYTIGPSFFSLVYFFMFFHFRFLFQFLSMFFLVP